MKGGWRCNLNTPYWRHSHLAQPQAGRSDSALEEGEGFGQGGMCSVPRSWVHAGQWSVIQNCWACCLGLVASCHNTGLLYKCPLSFGQLFQLVVLNSSWCVITGIGFLCGSEQNISLQFRAITILSFCSFLVQTKVFSVNTGQHAVKY